MNDTRLTALMRRIATDASDASYRRAVRRADEAGQSLREYVYARVKRVEALADMYGLPVRTAARKLLIQYKKRQASLRGERAGGKQWQAR